MRSAFGWPWARKPSDVLLMVVWRGMSLTLVGVALGLAVALALTRVLKNLLFERERDRSGDLRADRLAAGRRRPDCELHPGAARDEG